MYLVQNVANGNFELELSIRAYLINSIFNILAYNAFCDIPKEVQRRGKQTPKKQLIYYNTNDATQNVGTQCANTMAKFKLK